MEDLVFDFFKDILVFIVDIIGIFSQVVVLDIDGEGVLQ